MVRTHSLAGQSPSPLLGSRPWVVEQRGLSGQTTLGMQGSDRRRARAVDRIEWTGERDDSDDR